MANPSPQEEIPKTTTEEISAPEREQAVAALEHTIPLIRLTTPENFPFTCLHMQPWFHPDYQTVPLDAWITRECERNFVIRDVWNNWIKRTWYWPDTKLELLGISADRIRFVVPLQWFIPGEDPLNIHTIEIGQQCLSLVTLIVSENIRIQGLPEEVMQRGYSYHNFLASLRMGNQKGVSAEVYEESLQWRTKEIMRRLGVQGAFEAIARIEPLLAAYIGFIDNRYNGTNAQQIRRTPQAYTALITLATMLCLMQRDSYLGEIPLQGQLLVSEEDFLHNQTLWDLKDLQP